MDYEKGYVFDLMEQGGPTDVREPYFKGSWRLKGYFTLRKQNGTWKLTSSKASTY